MPGLYEINTMAQPNEESEGISRPRPGVNFYKRILRMKNPGNEPYPLVRLIGHRGGASKVVQDVAKTVHDLKNFCLSNPDVFIVTGDYVNLSKKHCVLYKKKEPEEPKAEVAHSSNNGICCGGDNVISSLTARNNPTPPVENGTLTETIHIANAVKFYFFKLYDKVGFAKCPLVNLIGHRNCASVDVQNMAKNPKQLKSFLQNFPKLFKVSENAVALSNTVAFDIKVLGFYIPTFIKISINNEVSLDKLLHSRNNASDFVKNIIINVKELRDCLSKYSDIFKIKGNTICGNSDFLTKIYEVSNDPLGVILSAVYDSVASKELKNVNIKLAQPPLISENEIHNGHSSGPTNYTLAPFNPYIPNTVCEDKCENSSPAVQFFMEFLWKSGFCRVVSINDLFKYKSEAPAEIQVACGYSIQEFRTFLCKHPESFIVTNENVLARRNIPRKKWSPPSKGVEEPVCSMVLNFFKMYTKDGKPEHIDKLYSKVGKCFTKTDGELLFRTSKDLSTFLDMFPQYFYIFEGQVVNILYHGKPAVKELSVKPNRLKSKEQKIIEPESSNPENIAWKKDVLKRTTFIESAYLCQNIVADIIKNENVIALDCEGLNLGADGFLSLIQIAKENGEIYVFDVSSVPELITSGNLQDLLESSKVLKVIHDCRNDSANIYNQYCVSIRNIFDTRVAHAVISNTIRGTKFPPIGFNKLCKMYGAPINSEKDELKDVYKTNPAFWLQRPLNTDMLAYAALDVACLVPHVYNAMRVKLGDNEGKVYQLSDEYSKSCW